MSSESSNEILLSLDERNLAHVLSAVAFAGIALRMSNAGPGESTCGWNDQGLVLKTVFNEQALLECADRFVRSIRWVPGIGSAEQGTFVAGEEIGSNPFVSLADDGQKKSPFKTFSGQVGPQALVSEHQNQLSMPDLSETWLSQTKFGIGSWGFDCRVGSHAYDLGFSSNDEGSGDRDPVFPAAELLSIAAASFFAAVQGWQVGESTVGYSIWTMPVSLSLVPFAVAGRLGGISGRRYKAISRGAACGKGAAYRFFPEATPENHEEKT